MTSSTSNSDSRRAPRPWGTWCVAAALLAALAVSVWEGYWRMTGHLPRTNDSYELWSARAREGLGAGERGVLFVGSSRIMAAVHLPTMRAARPGLRPVQLGVSMGSSLVPMQMIAQRTKFDGTIVMEVCPRLLFTWPDPVGTSSDRDWVARYADQLDEVPGASQPAYAPVEHELQLALQEALVSCAGRTHPIEVLKAARRGEQVANPFWWIDRDRFQFMDLERLDERFKISRAGLHRSGRAMTPAEFAERADLVRRLAERVRRRGGRVVVLRLAVTGGVAQAERERFPDADYWDVLRAAVGPDVWDCRDEPALRDYAMFDDDHLDWDQAPRFTEELVARLWPE